MTVITKQPAPNRAASGQVLIPVQRGAAPIAPLLPIQRDRRSVSPVPVRRMTTLAVTFGVAFLLWLAVIAGVAALAKAL